MNSLYFMRVSVIRHLQLRCRADDAVVPHTQNLLTIQNLTPRDVGVAVLRRQAVCDSTDPVMTA